MKKSILSIGKALNKVEQKKVHGGARPGASTCCNPADSCCIPQPIPVQLAQGCGQQSDPSCQYAYGNPSCFQHPYWTGCI